MATKSSPDEKKRGPRASATDDVYEKKFGLPNFDKPPHCIYFFYIKAPDPDGKNPIFHYYYRGNDQPIDTEDKLKTRIAALIHNAREPALSNQRPPPNGADLQFIIMERVSHFVFAYDFALTEGPTIRIKSPNHSFYDAQALEVEGCKVIACINHLKGGPGGEVLGNRSKPFEFSLQSNPPAKLKDRGRPPDSGGTNTGPAVSPP